MAAEAVKSAILDGTLRKQPTARHRQAEAAHILQGVVQVGAKTNIGCSNLKSGHLTHSGDRLWLRYCRTYVVFSQKVLSLKRRHAA